MLKGEAVVQAWLLGLQLLQRRDHSLVARIAVGMGMDVEARLPPRPVQADHILGPGDPDALAAVGVARIVDLHAHRQVGIIGEEFNALVDQAVGAAAFQRLGKGNGAASLLARDRGDVDHGDGADGPVGVVEESLEQRHLAVGARDHTQRHLAGGRDAVLPMEIDGKLHEGSGSLGRHQRADLRIDEGGRRRHAEELAVRFAVRPGSHAVDLERVLGDACVLHRGGVGVDEMLGGVPHDHRPVAGPAIDVGLGKMPAHGDDVVAPEDHGLAVVGDLGEMIAHDLGDAVDGPDAGKVRPVGQGGRHV